MQTPNAREFSVPQRFWTNRTTTTSNPNTAETLVTVWGDEKQVFRLLGVGCTAPRPTTVPAFQPAVHTTQLGWMPDQSFTSSGTSSTTTGFSVENQLPGAPNRHQRFCRVCVGRVPVVVG